MTADFFAQTREFLGVDLRPEIRVIVKEIKPKAGEEIYGEFVDQEDYPLGSSFISEEGVRISLVGFQPSKRR